MGLSSEQVLAFIPANTWTPARKFLAWAPLTDAHVFLMPGTKFNNNGIYMISTNEKYFKRCKDMYEMAIQSFSFEIISTYKFMEFVAVVIEGLWYRGRMLSFNEVLIENTVVELIDSGSIVKKQLCDLFKLPDCYKYDPLCLAVKPINGIANLKLRKLYVQPLLMLSELQNNYVVVNTKPIDEINELNLEVNCYKINKNNSLPFSTKFSCIIKDFGCNMYANSITQDDLLISTEKQTKRGYECINVIELSDGLKEAFSNDNNLYLYPLLDNINMFDFNKMFINKIGNMSKCLSVVRNNHLDYVNKKMITNNINNSVISNIDTSVIQNSSINDLKISECHLFKNNTLVEFVYGTNINFVYIRSYEEKQKYCNVMKMFYSYYKKTSNLKVQSKLNTGDMIAAYLSDYNEIHRAVILNKNIKNNSNQYYLCFFVDIGLKKYIKSNYIFHLLEETKIVPHLAFKVGLSNDSFTNTIQLKYLKNYFDLLYLQPLIIEFDECDPNGLNKVVLKNKSNNMNIYLEAKEFILTQLSSHNPLNNKEIEPKIIDYLRYDDLFKNGTKVIITNFHSLNHIYVRINSTEMTTYYNQIVTEVHQYYKNQKGAYQRKIPKINEKVAVKSLSKNQFVRACILEKVNNTTYSVNFVDYGGKENIKNNEIFVLPYRFRYLPQSVIKIGLNVKWPINIVKKLPDYFNQLIQSAVPLIAEFDEEDPFGFQSVVLRKETDGVDIYEDICNLTE